MAGNATDPLKLVIVRDMWLIGFDALSVDILYIGKPMKGQALMQAISRIHRVFAGKPAGLVVDHIGLDADLKKALAYCSQGDQAQTGLGEREALAACLSALEVGRALFQRFDHSHVPGESAADRMEILPAAADHVLRKTREEGARSDKDFGKCFHDVIAALAKAFKLAAGSPGTSASPAETCGSVL